jgi:hypothetical protein
MKKLLLLIGFATLTLNAQNATQQWITVLNSSSTSVDQLFGFSSPTGGCTGAAGNENYSYDVSNHIALNPSSTQLGFTATSNCNAFCGTINPSTGAVNFLNTNTTEGLHGASSIFDSSDNFFSLSKPGSSATQLSYLRKFNSAGTVSFTNSLINTTQYNSNVFGMTKTDAQGRIYTYGTLRAVNTNYFSNAVYCYDNNGALQWSSAINDLDWYFGYPGRMTVDNNNNVIFSGKRQTTQGDPFTYDIVLRKVNSSGVQQWQVYYDFGNKFDLLSSIVTDSNGDIYMVALNRTESTIGTERLVKFNGTTGAIIYQQQISSSYAGFNGTAKFNSNGNLLVGIDGLIQCYNPSNGTLLWTTPSSINYQAFTTDSNGNIYVTFNDKVQIYNSNGTLINTITPTIASYTVNLRMSEVDSSGSSLYIIGERSNATTNKVFITKYSLSSYSDTCNNVSGSLTQGLVGYWPFCGNANDDSGNGNNGTVNGATLTTDRFGNASSAYSFNGINNWIDILNSSTINFQNEFSISLWLNTNQNNINAGLIGKWNDFNGTLLGGQEEFAITVNDNVANTMFALLRTNASPNTNFQVQFDNSGYNGNQWNLFTYVFGNNSISLYKNGTLVGTSATTGTIVNYFQNLEIGRYGGGQPTSGGNTHFNGTLDDIGIWNRALTQQEITNLYNANQCFTNITVTDTLVINVGQLSYNNPVTYANNITIAPNPASSQINISFNNISNLNGGTLKIINSLGQQVATTPITTSGTQSIMQLSTWGGTGMYFVQIINPQGQIVDIKKIILQ